MFGLKYCLNSVSKLTVVENLTFGGRNSGLIKKIISIKLKANKTLTTTVMN